MCKIKNMLSKTLTKIIAVDRELSELSKSTKVGKRKFEYWKQYAFWLGKE